MTLGEFAAVLDVAPKWVHNSAAALGASFRYDLPTARRLAITRALVDATDLPLARAYAAAGELLGCYDGLRQPMSVASPDGTVNLQVDVYRILATLYTRLSRVRTSYAPRRRGRPPSGRRDPLDAAAAYGLDLTLLDANLRRTPAERLRQLDAMADFRRRVRRVRRG